MYLPKITCSCGDQIIKSNLDGVTKIRARIVIFKNDQAYAICKSCNSEVKIPVRVELDAACPPLFIKK